MLHNLTETVDYVAFRLRPCVSVIRVAFSFPPSG